MSTVVILNVAFAMLVVISILSLLGWAIVADRAITGPRLTRAHAPVHDRRAAMALTPPAPALDLIPE